MGWLEAKWLDLVNAGGLANAAIAVAAALLLYGNSKKWFPAPLDPRVLQIAIVLLVLCGCLSLASVASKIAKRVEGARLPWKALQDRRAIAASILEMTPKEKEIISHLLFHNQRMFTCTADGGHASTLISKGIVVCAIRPGQSITYYEVPFEVPQNVWKVLKKNRTAFPYAPPADPKAPQPWRIPWMAR